MKISLVAGIGLVLAVLGGETSAPAMAPSPPVFSNIRPQSNNQFCLDPVPNFQTGVVGVGSLIQTAPCDLSGDQLWTVTSSGEIQWIDGTLCVDIGAEDFNGLEPVMNTCNNSPSQQWVHTSWGGYQVFGGFCLQTTPNLVFVETWACNSSAITQKWTH